MCVACGVPRRVGSGQCLVVPHSAPHVALEQQMAACVCAAGCMPCCTPAGVPTALARIERCSKLLVTTALISSSTTSQLLHIKVTVATHKREPSPGLSTHRNHIMPFHDTRHNKLTSCYTCAARQKEGLPRNHLLPSSLHPASTPHAVIHQRPAAPAADWFCSPANALYSSCACLGALTRPCDRETKQPGRVRVHAQLKALQHAPYHLVHGCDMRRLAT
jgi:hypothetical protein